MLASLLFPSLAVALAAAELAPPAVLGGTLALAAVPIARRALRGARERHFRLPQIDLAVLGVLAASGEFLAAGLTTWVIAASHGVSGYLMSQVRDDARRGLPRAAIAATSEPDAHVELPADELADPSAISSRIGKP